MTGVDSHPVGPTVELCDSRLARAFTPTTSGRAQLLSIRARCVVPGPADSAASAWPAEADAARLVFELNALLHEANGHFLLFRDPVALEHARAAIADRLGAVRAPAR